VSDSKLARPPQVTLAGWLVVAGSVLVVLTALDQGAGLHSLDTREAVEEFLAGPPGDQLGLSLQGGLLVLRVLLTVAAVTATASAILGWYALQRSKAARLALSVLAVPLFLTGMSFQGGGVFPAVVAAAVVMLWFQPGRDWYDGIARAPAPEPPAAPAQPPQDPQPLQGPQPPQPSVEERLRELPPPTAPPLFPTAYAQPVRAAAAQERPRTVAWACRVTWVSTLVVFVLFGVYLIELLVAPDSVLEQLRRQNPDLATTDRELRQLVLVMCAVAMAWSAVAAGLAVLVWRRVGWAAVALGVSAGLASLTLLPIVPCVAAGVLMLRPEARAWFSR
jgi:hypothetical protein